MYSINNKYSVIDILIEYHVNILVKTVIGRLTSLQPGSIS